MFSGPIEQKAAAGTSATLIFGYLAALLIEVIPWLKDNLTPDQQQNLPIIIAFLATGIATYLAPHTHRPDLPPLVLAPPAPQRRPVQTIPPPAQQVPPHA